MCAAGDSQLFSAQSLLGWLGVVINPLVSGADNTSLPPFSTFFICHGVGDHYCVGALTIRKFVQGRVKVKAPRFVVKSNT